MQSSTNFARAFAGQHSLLDVAMGRPALGGATLRATSCLHTSPSARAGVPSLGATSINLNSGRWARAGAEEGLNVFDMKGALEALEKGPETHPAKRVHPAQLAHAARIARAQQAGITFNGYKVFPDLTPGRAFMWGTILAVYAVGVTSYAVARSVGITGVADVREKMQAAFAPTREALQARAAATKEGLTLREQPAVFGQLHDLGASISRTLGKPEGLLESDHVQQPAH